MSLRANTSKLIIALSNLEEKSYSLRVNALEGWMDKERYSYKDLARITKMSEEEFIKKVTYKKKFSKKKLKKLIEVMGEAEAFYIIYFKSYRDRCYVYECLFDRELRASTKHMKEEKINEI